MSNYNISFSEIMKVRSLFDIWPFSIVCQVLSNWCFSCNLSLSWRHIHIFKIGHSHFQMPYLYFRIPSSHVQKGIFTFPNIKCHIHVFKIGFADLTSFHSKCFIPSCWMAVFLASFQTNILSMQCTKNTKIASS